MSITVIIIAITVIISIAAFRSPKLAGDLIFDAYAVTNRKQYYRFITCGFVHADIGHLFFNMYAFYLFGKITEQEFDAIFGSSGKLLYILMYVLALIVCLIPSYVRNRNNPEYRSLGASGAVSAVVFAFILFNPVQGIGLVFIPVFLAGFLFGFLYLFVSYLLDRKGGGRINHSAHIWGALFGMIFLIVAAQLFSGYPVWGRFIDQVSNMDIHQIITTGHAF